MIVLLLVGVAAFGGDDSPAMDSKVQAGLMLVEQFYNILLSDTPEDECPDIFAEPLGPQRPANEWRKIVTERWRFLRMNRSLFLTERYETGEFYRPTDFYSKSRKMVSFFNPPAGKPYTEGLLYITLVSTVSRAGADGVYKGIAFPIVPAGKPGEYRIEFLGIKVNGVLLDMSGDFKRDKDYDLLKRLGFPRKDSP